MWNLFWSFNGKTLLVDKAKAQKLISAEMHGMRAFQLAIHEMYAFNSKCTYFTLKYAKQLNFHSNLLVSSEMVTEGYQGRPMKCAHFTHFNEMRGRKTLSRYGNSLVTNMLSLLLDTES